MNGRSARAPDAIQPIVGYRAWSYVISERGARLFPLGPALGDDEQSPWDGAWRGWVTASCLNYPLEPGHLAPEENCECGFYATKSLDDLPCSVALEILQANEYPHDGASAGVVLGRVDLAGKVIEHEWGYRAERARVAELIPTTDAAAITYPLASRLDLPVGPAFDTTSLRREFEEELALIQEQMRMRSDPPAALARPRLIDRWRLSRHRRHFRLIQGEGAARETGPFGGPFPPAA
jgi:hypothetical protein